MDEVVSLQVVLRFKRLTDVSEISLFIEEPSTSHRYRLSWKVVRGQRCQLLCFVPVICKLRILVYFNVPVICAMLRNSYKKHYSWHCI